MTRYRWVAAREAEGFPITKACEVAGVSRQAFYEWNKKTTTGPSDAEVEEARLVETMRDIHRDDDTVGSPRMTVALNNLGWEVNHKRVERLMRVNGLVGIPEKRTVRTTIPPRTHPRCLIWSVAASPWVHRIGRGVRTSPTSRPPRDGCIWPPSSTLDHGGCSATRWPTTCGPVSSPPPWTWPSGSEQAAVPMPSSTPTGAPKATTD